MPSALSHAAVAVALGSAFPAGSAPWRTRLVAAACAVAPDVDVLGIALGVERGTLLAHRGLTHSLPFAALIAALALAVPAGAGAGGAAARWLYFFLAAASHGLLDAMTNGGTGIAFLAPFSEARHFAPFRPIRVSPIGLRFFSEAGVRTLASEARWLLAPALALALLAEAARRRRRPHEPPPPGPGGDPA